MATNATRPQAREAPRASVQQHWVANRIITNALMPAWRSDVKSDASGPPRADHEQDDPTGQCEPAEYGGQRNGLPRFLLGVERPDVEDLFAAGVGDSLIRERNHAEDDQHDADERRRLHVRSLAEAQPTGNPAPPG